VDGTVYKLPLAEFVAILSEFMWQSGGVSGLQFLAHCLPQSMMTSINQLNALQMFGAEIAGCARMQFWD